METLEGINKMDMSYKVFVGSEKYNIACEIETIAFDEFGACDYAKRQAIAEYIAEALHNPDSPKSRNILDATIREIYQATTTKVL